MVVRIMRILVASAIMVLLVDVRPAVCEGWSILHPFSSSAESKKEPKTKKPAMKTAKQEPSTFNKMGQGTKKFFSQTGETLGLKKPEPKKPQYATAKPPTIQPKQKESKSWFGSMFEPEEKKPKTVGEWMSQNKRMDPN